MKNENLVLSLLTSSRFERNAQFCNRVSQLFYFRFLRSDDVIALLVVLFPFSVGSRKLKVTRANRDSSQNLVTVNYNLKVLRVFSKPPQVWFSNTSFPPEAKPVARVLTSTMSPLRHLPTNSNNQTGVEHTTDVGVCFTFTNSLTLLFTSDLSLSFSLDNASQMI